METENIFTKRLDRLPGLLIEQERWDYSIAIHPDRATIAKLEEEKRDFYKTYNCPGPLQDEFYITIAEFHAKEQIEPTLIRWIQNVCNLQSGFITTLNNYSSYPTDRIYLRIQDPGPYQQLINGLKIIDAFIQSNEGRPMRLAVKPILNLVTGLPGAIYEQAVKDYSQKTFCESFFVDRIVLLRKNNCSPFRVINTFTLSR